MVSFKSPFARKADDQDYVADDASQYSTSKDQSYELSQMQSESSYTGAHSSVYRDPYGDNVPLTEVTPQPTGSYNPWVPGAQQLDPNSAAAAGITISPELPPPRMALVKKSKAWPWFLIFISFIQIVVFIAELIVMGKYTGKPIETKPEFNPMIGPSPYVQIHMGSRFAPCMHSISGITDDTSIKWPCPNATTSADKCSLSELCGMGGIDTDHPNQWWRFITPIFIHAGFLHIIMNMVLQVMLGFRTERELGHLKTAIIYLAAGINGFVLGGNFTPNGISSCGASGALFGFLAVQLVDLVLNWRAFEHPKSYLFRLLIDIVISFVMGLLPGIDNFAHIGGFMVGITLGIALLRSPLKIREMSGEDDGYYYAPTAGRWYVRKYDSIRIVFKNKPAVWYLWVFIRLFMIVLTAIYMIVLIRNFKEGGGHCSWCKYLSCVPISNWCESGYISAASSSSSSKLMQYRLFE
ncbi:rhomboid family membrane protein [Myxozyma melibiosi]|uniref:Rhomboid-type serine protease n=1 Tax=Myxozyma melibiosi TaxID=54550 RepID=A0ABR1FDE4_9ASCO